MTVWLNGKFYERDEARVSVFDAGFQHAVGLFETMCVRNGRAFRPQPHLERLATSSKALMLTQRLRTEPLEEAVQLVIERSGLTSARLRLTVTGGNLNMLQTSGQSQQDPTILIVVQPPTPYPSEFFSQGVIVSIAAGRRNPLDPMSGHKTLNYWPNILALQAAAPQGASEVLWFAVTNHLACASVGNVFLVKDGELLTPFAMGEEASGALPAPVRPGVTRETIIELAKRDGVETHRRMLTIEDVLEADELFLTNSSWGVLPVVQVEREKIGGGEVGVLTQRLRTAWLEQVEAETAF